MLSASRRLILELFLLGIHHTSQSHSVLVSLRHGERG